MKNKNDYDLDFINLFKDFPNDENNAFIFIRSNKTDGIFITAKGSVNNLSDSLLSSMIKSEGFSEIVLNSVINYLDKKGELGQFIESIQEFNK